MEVQRYLSLNRPDDEEDHIDDIMAMVVKLRLNRGGGH